MPPCNKPSVLFVTDWPITQTQLNFWGTCLDYLGLQADFYHLQLNGFALPYEILNRYTGTGIYFLLKHNRSFTHIDFKNIVNAVKASDGADGGLIIIGKDTSDSFVRLNIAESSDDQVNLGTDQFYAKEGLISKPDGARDALETVEKLLSEYNRRNPLHQYVIHNINLDIQRDSAKKIVTFGTVSFKKLETPNDLILLCIPQDPTDVSSSIFGI